MSENEPRSDALSEKREIYKDHDFYILHGNFQPKLPAWERQFGQFLIGEGAPRDQVHTPYLKNLLADYRSWRRDSGLPNKSENSEKSIIIGHSSGSEMALVYAEHNKIAGMILFAPYDKPDTGSAIGPLISPLEKASGMFTKSDPNKIGILYRIEREFKWDSIVRNCGFITVVHATGDTLFVPEASSKNVYDKLKIAAEKFSGSVVGEGDTSITYLSLEGKSHDPELEQFKQVLSRV
jgi:hypothetical protein